MKMLTTLIAAGMLFAGTAFAAYPAPDAPAAPAAPAAAAPAAPAAAAPAAAPADMSHSAAMSHSGKACKRQAYKQHLKGAARTDFIKNCRASM